MQKAWHSATKPLKKKSEVKKSINVLVKTTLGRPYSKNCLLRKGAGGGGGGQCVNRQLTERNGGQERKLLRLLQVNKKHSKNTLIFYLIVTADSQLY